LVPFLVFLYISKTTEIEKMKSDVRNAVIALVAKLEEAMKSPKTFLVDGTQGSSCHTYEIEGDHFQANDVGLTIYDANGNTVACFAPGNWKNCVEKS
jgi:hypothetical protein